MPYGLAGNPIRNETGVITGSATALQFPDKPCIRVKFKNPAASIGNFYIGGSAATTVWELDATQEADWIDIGNLNQLWYRNPSGTVDKINYWLQY